MRYKNESVTNKHKQPKEGGTMMGDLLSENLSLLPEKMLEKYGEMSVAKQRVEFGNLFGFLYGIAENEKTFLLLTLLRFTKSAILIKNIQDVPTTEQATYKKIMKVADLFKYCLEKLSEIPKEKLHLFLARMSSDEISDARIFSEQMVKAFSGYPEHNCDPAEIYTYRNYAHRYSDILQEQKNWILEMVEDYKSGTQKSKRRVLEEGRDAFKKSEKNYKCGGIIFLLLTSSVAAALLLWGLQLGFNIFCFPLSSSDSYLFIASSIAGKIIISATLFFLLGAFSKIHFAYKHNETICRQRHDVLSSYEDIYNITDEKKFVLQKVAEAVFSHQPTGFSKLQSDKGDSSISLSDVVNLISKNNGNL